VFRENTELRKFRLSQGLTNFGTNKVNFQKQISNLNIQVKYFLYDFEFSWFLDNKMPVTDKHVLVIGSEVPWLEAVLLSKGAKKITTFDYATIESRHPQVEINT